MNILGPGGYDSRRCRYLLPRLPRMQMSFARVSCRVVQTSMDKTIRKYTSLDAMKAAELRDWQRLSGLERLDAAAELSVAAYQMKGSEGDVQPRLQRTLVHLRRPQG